MKSISDIKVSFYPAQKQVNEIEKWLIAERKKTGEGFYCNWEIIKLSYKKNELVTISLNNKTIGFATWKITSDFTGRINIVEVKPIHRNNGIGRKLITHVFDFLKERNICTIDLECSPPSSEPVWKSLGFKDFPYSFDSHRFNATSSKQLYKIIVPYLEANSNEESDEIIELWNNEPHLTKEKNPTWTWKLQFKRETRELIKPIIHPAHYEWRLRWRVNNKTIKDEKVKYFSKEIDFGQFIIIEEMPYLE